MKRERLLMDPGWRFQRGDFHLPRWGGHWTKAEAFAQGPIDPDYDDSCWRVVDLPHDFVVEGEYTRDAEGGSPLPAVLGAPQNLSLYVLHGFLPGGVGWYRKTFFVPKEDAGRRLALEFDGAFRNSTCWLNRHFLGNHLSGYTGFRYDVSALVNYGGLNTLVVRVDATEDEGWFYEGGGIYRHVWLTKTSALFVSPHGVFVSCEVEGDPNPDESGLGTPPARPGAWARATVRTTVRNEHDAAQNCRVRSVVKDPSGKAVASAEADLTVPSGGEAEAVQNVDLPTPSLWSPETPKLYTLTTTIAGDGQAVDECETPFGIRHIRFDPDRGFLLNGRAVKLKGVCCHQDHAGVGAALPDRVQAYRIERLKDMGCNSLRTSHNPPTPELLDACDRLGMLVLAENRLMGTAPDILEQLEFLIRRDRNHPSVIFWSLANEEMTVQATEAGARMAADMKRRVKRLDPTRPVTQAMNGAWGAPLSSVLDVQGCNYITLGDIDAFHRQFPDKPIVFTESCANTATRGIYVDDPVRGYVNAYGTAFPNFGTTPQSNWSHCDARPFVSGTFVWTGFDYRGEQTPYADWPCVSSHFGILDLCGYPKDSFFYYQSWWGDGTVLHLFPHWNWRGRRGQEISVWAYTNCDSVELLLNGRSLGRREVVRNGHAEWKVPYEPGQLTAVGHRAGQQVTTTVETTGAPAAIRLVSDRDALKADGEDVAMVRVEVVDEQGRLVPDAGEEILFETSGNGRLIGLGNGDPSDHASDKGTVRRVFNGLAQAIVQSTRQPGGVRLTARSEGLRPAALDLTTRGAVRPHVPSASNVSVLAFECSPLAPAAGGIAAAAPPPDNVAFQPVRTIAKGGLNDVRSFHNGADGVLYLRSRVSLPSGGPGRLLYGADGPVKLWVNGAEVACQPTASNPLRPDEYSARVQWRPGENIVVFALASNGGKAWGVCARAVGR